MPNACTRWGFTGISSMWFGWSYSRLFTLLDADQENTRMNSNGQETTGNVIHVPGSTGWPLVAAFGLTMVFAGLLTHVMVSTLGAVTLCMGLVGWFRQVLPQDVQEAVALGEVGVVLPRPNPHDGTVAIGRPNQR